MKEQLNLVLDNIVPNVPELKRTLLHAMIDFIFETRAPNAKI